jgi:glycosyltransferase involved in cell wall biosynthesis
VSIKWKPLISVITACYNAEMFIEQCVQSVVTQNFEGVEHVVIDGGSTDGTVKIIERYASKISYWHSKPDRGIGHAFNLGVQHSRGDWLLFLNSDDYFCRADAVEILARPATSSGVDVVYGKVQPVSRESSPRLIGQAVGWPFSPWSFLLKDLIPHPAALTSREYFTRVGPFREDLKIVLDYEHYLRSYREMKTICLPEVLTHMRAGGISSDRNLCLEEMLHAQKLNSVLPPIAQALLGTFVRTKAATGRLVRTLPWLLGPASSRES